MNSLPNNKPLDELEIHDNVKRLKIKYFRGVFMRDDLPKKCHNNECSIINLDSSEGSGTHWVAYSKRGKEIYYFDSFGDLSPPKELITYFGSDVKIFYNYLNYQKYDTVICGQLCITFLYYFNKHFF